MIAKKNVQVTDNLKEIKITTNQLKYNKDTLILTAIKDVKIIDNLNKVTLKADKIIYYKNQEKIITVGKTEIEVDKTYLIHSSDITFFRNEMIISSDKNTSLKDNLNNQYNVQNFNYLINDKILRGKEITLITNEHDRYLFKD